MIPGIIAGGMAAGSSSGDPYWDQVAFYLRANGASGSTAFVDEKGSVWTAYGNAQQSDGDQLFGNNCLLDGAGDFLQCDSNWPVESEDFTLDVSYRPSSVSINRTIFYNGSPISADYGVLLRAAGSSLLFAMLGGANVQTSGGVLSVGTWARIRVCRDTTSTRIYVGGSQVASGTQSNGGNAASFKARWGRYRDAVSDYGYGRLDEMRLTMGVARTTGSSYAVGSSEFPIGGG